MKDLNKRFDTTKPFIEGLLAETVNKTEVSDALFEQACEEYGIKEEDAMLLMINNTEYEFMRVDISWAVIPKEL